MLDPIPIPSIQYGTRPYVSFERPTELQGCDSKASALTLKYICGKNENPEFLDIIKNLLSL